VVVVVDMAVVEAEDAAVVVGADAAAVVVGAVGIAVVAEATAATGAIGTNQNTFSTKGEFRAMRHSLFLFLSCA
jgi:hypothetical protein